MPSWKNICIRISYWTHCRSRHCTEIALAKVKDGIKRAMDNFQRHTTHPIGPLLCLRHCGPSHTHYKWLKQRWAFETRHWHCSGHIWLTELMLMLYLMKGPVTLRLKQECHKVWCWDLSCSLPILTPNKKIIEQHQVRRHEYADNAQLYNTIKLNSHTSLHESIHILEICVEEENSAWLRIGSISMTQKQSS